MTDANSSDIESLLSEARALRQGLGDGVHDRLAASLYGRAGQIAEASVRHSKRVHRDWDLIADKILTGRFTGFAIMVLGLGVILWLTILGANVPSGLLFDAFFWLHDKAEAWMNAAGAPWWLTGFLINGVYRSLAWVIAVMLPPMAIFFPIFTLLEDVGYLPRVAFNMDRMFRWCGAQGKQALTMGMGLGCNAAGVVACRIIESPRERLIAILTNNFMLCNGRWPTIIMLATVFVAAAFPPAISSIVAAATVVAVMLLGVLVTFIASRFLSRTVLKGEVSQFYLELPPYRRPNVLRVIHRSIIDRTLFVLGRACVTAAPAGAVIWLLGNIRTGGVAWMDYFTGWLDPIAGWIGLDGVILAAYVIALPANEIIVPTIIMAYLATGQMTELDDMSALGELFREHDWTIVTAVCMMLFSLLHNPCATTTWTIYRETKSVRWTLWSNFMPLTLAVLACGAVAQIARLF